MFLIVSMTGSGILSIQDQISIMPEDKCLGNRTEHCHDDSREAGRDWGSAWKK
jgi:hypothetical protein